MLGPAALARDGAPCWLKRHTNLSRTNRPPPTHTHTHTHTHNSAHQPVQHQQAPAHTPLPRQLHSSPPPAHTRTHTRTHTHTHTHAHTGRTTSSDSSIIRRKALVACSAMQSTKHQSLLKINCILVGQQENKTSLSVLLYLNIKKAFNAANHCAYFIQVVCLAQAES